MSHPLGVLGVPTSAGAHFPGLEQGPEHFRRAGLLARLLASGFDVLDLGDLPMAVYETDRTRTEPRSLSRVSDVARQVAQQIATAHARGLRSIVIGGDCSITAGVISGLARASDRIGLVYFDGHVDLNTVETSDYGVLDSMVMSHLLGIVDNGFSRLGPIYPLLDDERVLFVGYDPAGINDGEIPLLAPRRSHKLSLPDLTRTPEMAAAALRDLEERVDTIVVHFDVDVINFIDFPVANFPWYNGLSLEQVSHCLEQFLASPKFGHLVLTEFNPDRDRHHRYAEQLINILADKLLLGSVSWSPQNNGSDPGISHAP